MTRDRSDRTIAACLLLILATAGLWCRSRQTGDAAALFAPGGRPQAVASCDGHLLLFLSTIRVGSRAVVDCTNGPAEDLDQQIASFRQSASLDLRWAGFSAALWRDVLGQPRSRCLLVAVPHWFAMAVLALPLLRVAIRRCRRRWRLRHNRCLTCGYDLRATPDRCPECGTARDGCAGMKTL